ncbi:MAG: hypothetical protein OEZ36_12600 [Spirochaetota bacterium]|nr:hypothetical protein [Spirochaetota bacterium]
MSLDHEFRIVKTKSGDYSEFRNYINHPDNIRVHDDVFGYIYDTLLWIPVLYNNGSEGYGPDRFAISIIRREGALIASRIFHGWIELFSAGPDKLNLVGDWCIDGETEDGSYEKLILDKMSIIEAFTKIKEMCQFVAENNNYYYLLHMGI